MLFANPSVLKFSSKPLYKKHKVGYTNYHKKKTSLVSCRSSMNGLEVFTHCVVYYTIFYTTFNWQYYRKIRNQIEKHKKNVDTHEKDDRK